MYTLLATVVVSLSLSMPPVSRILEPSPILLLTIPLRQNHVFVVVRCIFEGLFEARHDKHSVLINADAEKQG